MATTLNAGTSTSGAALSADATGILQLQTGSTPTTAVTIDTSQNVGIGTASPDSVSNFRFLDVGSSSTNQGALQANNGTVKTAIYVNGTEGYLATRTNHNLSFQTNGTTRAAIDTSGNFQFNSGYGSVATAYGCRAWVNFNGTGTVAIRASGNVSSITDLGVGYYRVNFTNAMPDNNYSCCATANEPSGAVRIACTTNFIANSAIVFTFSSSALADVDVLSFVATR